MTRRLLAGLLLAIVGLVALPRSAAAHPLGNFTKNRASTIDVAGQRLRITFVADLAEIPTVVVHQQLADNAGFERQQAATLASHVTVAIDGQRTPLQLLDHRLEFQRGQAGLDTTRLSLLFDAALPTSGEHTLTYSEDTYGDALGWREVVAVGSHGGRIIETDVPSVSRSNGLRAYPNDLISSPLHVTTATVRFTAGTDAALGSVLHGAPGGLRVIADRYADLVATKNLTPPVLAGALLVAVVLGAGHALTPGHGKAVMSGYLVGARRTRRDAVLLAATITVTHTLGVFALGFITLFLSSVIAPDRLYPILTVASALMILALGLALVVSRARLMRAAATHAKADERGGAEHGHHDHGSGSHTHPHGEASDEGANHQHGGAVHVHAPPERFSLSSLIAMGVSGGLIPCPSALVVLLAALQIHRVAFGIVLIVAFSAGLSVVLTGIGVLVAAGAPLLARLPRGRMLRRMHVATRFASIASAGALALAGLALTVQAVPGLR